MTRPSLEQVYERINIFGEGGCWIWTGYVAKHGYGLYSVGPGRQLRAHRVVYELLVEPIPKGLVLDHLCRVTACVNPDHLEPVTIQENVRRAFRDQTHCKWGHEYTPENTYRPPKRSTRRCKECNRIRARRNYARKRQQALS